MKTIPSTHAFLRRLATACTLIMVSASCRRDPVELAISDIDSGNSKEAETLLARTVVQEPNNASALANLAILQYRKGLADAALASFSKVADLVPDDPRPIEYIAAILIEEGHWKDAGDLLVDAARRDPRSLSVQTAQSLVDLNTTGAQAAKTRLLQVIAIDPSYAPALFNLAVIERDWLKDSSEARRYFQRFLAVARNDIHAPIAKAALAEKPPPPAPLKIPSTGSRHRPRS